MERLAELRESRALTLRQLAQTSGVDANTINQIELGNRKARPSTIRKLASALGVSVEELEKPANGLALYLGQEAEHAADLVEIAGRVRETLEASQKDASYLEFTARFLEILDEGLRNLSESLHEAHRIETGERKRTEKSTDDRLTELLREWEAEKV
jgi:transcriptional regulator with XRE-family HTH domain